MHYQWNWGVFWEQSPEGTGTYLLMLLHGLETTLVTSALAWALALALGVLIGTVRSLPGRVAQLVSTGWIELFRNIPLLVQLFLLYFVLPELLPDVWGKWLKSLPNSSLVTTVTGVGLFISARVAVQVAAGIASLPPGQKAAGIALGLTTTQTYRYVILPTAFRTILPPLTSEMLNTVKNTSVGLTIGLAELTARARAIQEYSYQVFEAFSAATLIYLIINMTATFCAHWLERRVRVPGHGKP